MKRKIIYRLMHSGKIAASKIFHPNGMHTNHIDIYKKADKCSESICI